MAFSIFGRRNEHLLAALRAPEGGLREALALVDAGASSVVLLLDAMKDSDPRVRGLASFALGELGHRSPEVEEALADRLTDPDEQVRWSAVRAFGSLRGAPPQTLKHIHHMATHDPSPVARNGAAEALVALGKWTTADASAEDDPFVHLSSQDPERREAALDAITRLAQADKELRANDEILGRLVWHLTKDEHEQARSSAALAIGAFGRAPENAANALATTALGDTSAIVQIVSVQVLARLASVSAFALNALRQVADAEGPKPVTQRARDALRSFGSS